MIWMLSEHDESVYFAKILRSKWILFSKLAQEIWTPSYNQIKKHKAEGMWKWVPDYMIVLITKTGKKVLCFIEMKRLKWWVISLDQKKRIHNLNMCWVKAKVCNWAKEALIFIFDIIENG